MTTRLTSGNWTAVLLEFLIVVFGVFIGLQAQQWYEQRDERQREQEYVVRLAADFEAIRKDLDRCQAIFRRSIGAAEDVADRLRNERADGSSRRTDGETLADVLIRMTAGSLPAGRSTTFVEMLSTGELSLLRDDALRDRLIAYDERARINRDIWRSLRNEQAQNSAALYQHVRIAVDDIDSRPSVSLREVDMAAMAADPDFAVMVNVLIGAKINNLDICRWQAELAGRVSSILDTQLAD